ncbi:MAG: radical SAM protein [Planctomycetes bacterium]|nr:radical SAM protein [Planctomycetota bacterium]
MPRATIAAIFLQPQCDMRCSFCAADENYDRMTRKQAEQLVDELAAKKYESIVLGGGEPMLWPNGTIELAAYVQSRGMIAQINTNGQRLPDGFAQDNRTDRWILPIESNDAQTHNSMRHTPPRHYELVQSRLDDLQQSPKTKVTLSTVVCAENISHLPQLAHEILQRREAGLPLHAWHLYRFIAQGRGGAISSARHAVTDQNYLTCAREAQGILAREGAIAYLRPDMSQSTTVSFHWYEKGRHILN